MYTHERTRGGRLKLSLLHEFRPLPTHIHILYVHKAVASLCRNTHLYLYHVLKEVSEVVFLVDKHLDVPTGVGVLWHTGCKQGREGRRWRSVHVGGGVRWGAVDVSQWNTA